MEEFTIKKKVVTDITGTFETLPIGKEFFVKNTVVKTQIVRPILSRLKLKGLEFKCTDRGLVDGCIVTRLK